MSWKPVMHAAHESDISASRMPFSPFRLEKDGKFTLERHVERCLEDALGAAPRAILDVGCGMGLWLAIAGKLPPSTSYTGVDFSDAQLDKARKSFSDGNIRFLNVDIEESSFGESCFDLAACHLVLHLLDNPQAVLESIHRALTPGGSLHVMVPAPWLAESTEERRKFRRIARRMRGYVPETVKGGAEVHAMDDEESIRAALGKAGFDPHSIEFSVENLVVQGKPSDVISHFLKLYAFDAIPDQDKPKAAADLLEAAIQEQDASRNVISHRPMAFIKARKTSR